MELRNTTLRISFKKQQQQNLNLAVPWESESEKGNILVSEFKQEVHHTYMFMEGDGYVSTEECCEHSRMYST